MLNDRSTPLSLLASRRSSKARDMVAPGPSDTELAQMLQIAARTPDHGKLSPWRFVVVDSSDRTVLADALEAAWRAGQGGPEGELAPIREFAFQAPCLIVCLSSPVEDSKIPLWEQQLSTGAAVMNLAHAAHALGYGACWLTGWAAYSDRVRDLFGKAPERIAGFLFVGTQGKPAEERPRPAPEKVWSRWNP